ncbi:MAG: GxxExxY protein [Lewinellaceae bacterium]|nr:GxxExxY protein [Lewinellaceae bacterium]
MNDLLTGKIIAAAYKVYNSLGFGFLEKVYENALVIELRKNPLAVSQQIPLTVIYDEQVVGDYAADLMVENEVIVEIKSIVKLTTKHEAQLVNYLTATKNDIGLLINFGPEGVEVKRKYRVYRPKAD